MRRAIAAGDEPEGRGSALVRADHPWVDEELAALYDRFPFEADIPFYLGLVGDARSRTVLELACGTGRLLLPLAAVVDQITGVDASPHMLARARHKLMGAPAEASARVRLVQDDMRSFRLDHAFDVAIVAAKSFGHLLTPRDQLAALGALRRHLEPGGVLALDLLNPSPHWLGRKPGWVWHDLLQEVPGEDLVVSRKESVVRSDGASQVRIMRSEYEEVASDGTVRKRFVEWPIRFTYRFEAEHLLARAGFEVEAVHGGYDREPYDQDAPTMLVVARRA